MPRVIGLRPPALPAHGGAASFRTMSTLAEIEDVIETLPTPDQEKLFAFLALRLGQGQPEPQTSAASVLKEGGHSVLDIPAAHVGRVLRPPSADDDLLGEMLEGRG